MGTPQKAYKNLEFLNSPEARIIRILAEYLEPKKRFELQQISNTIVFFGSSRLRSPEEIKDKLSKNLSDQERKKYQMLEQLAHYYSEAKELAYRLTKWNLQQSASSYAICSGGGPGIMEAANRGAREAGGKSVGLGISLPDLREPLNPYITDELNFEFHYFFMRKFWFVYLAKALVVFPGGFGTLDELFEILTLIQTKKIKKNLPIVIYGKDYWQNVINFEYLSTHHFIENEDNDLYFLADTVDEAFQYITDRLNQSQHNSR
ncbi:MAG: LOG family protein [Calditrichia bacterium]